MKSRKKTVEAPGVTVNLPRDVWQKIDKYLIKPNPQFKKSSIKRRELAFNRLPLTLQLASVSVLFDTAREKLRDLEKDKTNIKYILKNFQTVIEAINKGLTP